MEMVVRTVGEVEEKRRQAMPSIGRSGRATGNVGMSPPLHYRMRLPKSCRPDMVDSLKLRGSKSERRIYMDRGYIPVINIGGFERFVHAVEKECKRYGVPAPDRAEIVEYAQTCMCKRVFEAWRQDELETMQQIEAENAAGVKSDIERMAEDTIARILREMFGVSELTWFEHDVTWGNFLEFIKKHSAERLQERNIANDAQAIQRMTETLNNKTDIQKDTSSEAGEPDGQPCSEDP